MQNPRKVAVIGCGFVGASIAFSLMQKGLFSELVLIDSNEAKAHGEAMDLSHGLPYAASMDIYAGSYDDIVDCALITVSYTHLDVYKRQAWVSGLPKEGITELMLSR